MDSIRLNPHCALVAVLTLSLHRLDLASLKSVRECAEQLGNSLEKVRMKQSS